MRLAHNDKDISRSNQLLINPKAWEASPGGTGAPSSLVVLGERSVLCYSQTGQLRFLIRLDYRPLSLYLLNASAQGERTGIVLRSPTYESPAF